VECVAVDCPRDIYRASALLRNRPSVPHTDRDLLDALYMGTGNLGPEPFYDAMWSALEAHIKELELKLGE
jgi:hypothetical protein